MYRLILLFFIGSVSAQPRIQLSTGEIEGRLHTTKNNNSAYVYLRVPYAEPPINDLRWRNPEPKKAWSGVLLCKEYGPACMSNSSKTSSPQSYIGEDCLHMNVFAGTICMTMPCPVMYYLHGGGFNYDAATMFPQDTLIDNFASKGIVFVTVGFRLGAMGFWWTNSNETMGNYGFYDIIHGLKWVQQEIRNFGGNPNNVTVMGHSSGASGASLLTLAPSTKGLFHQALAMSGSPLTGVYPPYTTTSSKEFAVRLGCATEEEWAAGKFDKITSCMRAQDANNIIAMQRELENSHPIGGVNIHDERLWPERPDILATSRRPMPMLVGTTKNEQSFTKLLVPSKAGESFLKIPCVLMAELLGMENTDVIVPECVTEYSKRYGSDIPNAVANMTSEVQAFLPALNDALTMRDQAPNQVYLYSFDYMRPGMEGFFPGHAQDLTYVMGVHPFEFSDDDCRISKLYTNFFVNFAKFGKPHIQWKAVTSPTGFNYFSINLRNSGNEPFYHYEAYNFWETVAPALDEGAEWAKSQRKQAVVEKPKDWETPFWIMLCVLIIVIIGIVLIFSTQRCGAKKAAAKPIRMEDPDEGTGLLSSDTEADRPSKYYTSGPGGK